jgi:hypothetical protein
MDRQSVIQGTVSWILFGFNMLGGVIVAIALIESWVTGRKTYQPLIRTT